MSLAGWIAKSAALSLLWAIVCFFVVLPFGGDEYSGGEYATMPRGEEAQGEDRTVGDAVATLRP